MNTNNKIAWTHLTSKVQQLVVAVLSVMFGISMYIFMNGFVGGINTAFDDITFSTMAHIRVYNDMPNDEPSLISHTTNDTIQFIHNARHIKYTEGIKNAQEIIQIAKGFAQVTAVTEQINQNVFFQNGITKVSGNLSGIDVENEDKMFGTSKYMLKGHIYDLEKRNDGIVLGSGLAQSICVNVGDNVTLMTADGTKKSFKVLGIFESGASATDKSKAMISIRSARQLFSKNASYASDIQINVKDYNKAEVVSGKMAKIVPYKVESWKEGNSQLESSSTLRNILAMVISAAILTVAGFGIYNIMNMTVNEKMREIAILKAMGFNGKDIVHIFLLQSLCIGVIGGIAGMGLGSLIIYIVRQIPYKIASFTSLPVAFRLVDYIMAFFFGLIVTIIAGYLPARKASRVDPVEILRG
jgi:ABC-type transport system, involved in lipoprotein release, permease component